MERRTKNKKGAFFSLDSMVASAILLMSLMLVTWLYEAENPTAQINYLANDLANTLSFLENRQMTDDYSIDLINNGTITDLNMTAIEQIAEFYYWGNYTIAGNYSKFILENIVPVEKSFGVWVDGMEIYSRDVTESNNVINSRQMVMGINQSATPPKIYGPILIEVRSWQ